MDNQNSILKSLSLFLCLITIAIGYKTSKAQEKLYTNTFPLGDITIHEGPFSHARDLNIHHLLQYDVNRLLAPYRKQAGLEPKAESYPNWIGLDGHVGGHYLSAMAINYAASGNPECKKRMDYMLAELKICQEAGAENNPQWGVGYLGGVPESESIWKHLQDGDPGPFRSAWVPWYNLHKMYAGLRDAWSYGGSKEAKAMFLKFCDWGINITSGLSDEQMEAMLGTEHGGMNEVYADAYKITGEKKYLDAAKRFSHKFLLEPLATGIDNLDNLHANTQVPKAVGFQRIAELGGNEKYAQAGTFFWETVTKNRSLAFGGNSRREHFPAASACTDYIADVEGPESCNTNNMLKLTQVMFRMQPSATYADYYERALFNHILSSQHPGHG
ncbi:MAG: beta-L-arabinofuranosidase domain-containing protein, partial [Mariniphaga sp.]